MGKKKTWKNIKRAFPLYIMVAPGFLYLLINNYVPMTGIIIAFKHLNFAKGILHSDWAGLSNFKYLFKTPDAALITRNTLLYNFAFIVVNTTVSILIAILLSELRSKTKVKIFQSAVLIPSLISIIIVSYLVYAFLSGRTGFVNEAAEIDGATRWHKIKCITLPLLKSTVITMTLLSIGRIFYSDFGLFYQVPMNSGALINATNTIDTYVYRGLIELGDISMSSAACVYQSLMGFALVMIANWLTKRYSSENALF